MNRSAPPFSFFFLHACTAWPIGVIALALGSSLVRAGVSVRDASQIIAVTSLAFTFEFVWAPLVDASLTRKVWYIAGSIVMGACLAAVLVAPWNVASVSTLTVLALTSSIGAAVAAVAVKGIMAYDVPVARLGAASGFYTAGGTFAKAIGGAGTLWLVTHLSSRAWAATCSLSAAAIAASAIGFASPSRSLGLGECPAKLRSAITELWAFARTRNGFLIALVCVVPFGAGAEAGLIGAISREWGVSPDQLASIATASAATNIAGAMFGGWLSARVGPLKAYLLQGWAMIAAMVIFAFAPRITVVFVTIELSYRALATGCYAALLGIVITAIGKGAASTKAAALWSLTNLAFFYPTVIEGAVHDSSGTVAMLLTDAGLGVVGFGVIFAAFRQLKNHDSRNMLTLAPSISWD